jgi:curved DNA-binding protein CbpA
VHAVPAEWLTLDLYAELGVHRTATPEQVRAAYRDLAQRFHPDRRPGDALAEDRFKRISAAYRVLADPVARASYDRLHLAGPRPVPVRPAPAHRVPPSYRSGPARRPPSSAAGPALVRPAPTPDEKSTLVGVAVLFTVGAILLVAAIAIAVWVIGTDCDLSRELPQLGCPSAP